MNKVRVQVDLDTREVAMLTLLQKQLSVRSRADLLQQAYGTFLWVVDEMLSGRHVISVENEILKDLPRFRELNIPAVAPLHFQHYHYLVARPETGRSQLYLKGRSMTVGQLIYKMRANDLNAEEAAEDMGLPVDQVREALVYYETNRELIETEAEEEKRTLRKQGVPLELENLP